MDKERLEEIYSAPYGVELHGPDMCNHYRITVDGVIVPNMFAYRRADTDTEWTVQLDGRFEYDMDDSTLRQSMSLVANAMAIAAGYDHFGANSQPRNPYRTVLIGLSADEGEELAGQGEQ